MRSGKTKPVWPRWRRIRNEPCVLLTEMPSPRIARQGTVCLNSARGQARKARGEKLELDEGFQRHVIPPSDKYVLHVGDARAVECLGCPWTNDVHFEGLRARMLLESCESDGTVASNPYRVFVRPVHAARMHTIKNPGPINSGTSLCPGDFHPSKSRLG